MFCHKCGKPADDNALFCSHCGAKLNTNEKPQNKPSTTTHLPAVNKKKLILLAAMAAVLLLLLGGIFNKDTSESKDTSHESSETADVLNEPEAILYKKTNVLDLIGKTSSEIEEILGSPEGGTPVTGELLFGGTVYYTYDNLSLWFDDQDCVVYITASADSLKIGKKKLDVTVPKLTDIIGDIGNEGSLYRDEDEFDEDYTIQYITGERIITFIFEDEKSKADTIEITGLREYEEDYYPEIDNNLVGRWRSDDGGILEFNEEGYLTNCNLRCWTITDYSRANNGAPNRIYWTAQNGRITFMSEFDYDEPYQFSTANTEYGTSYNSDYEIMSIGKKNSMISWHKRGDDMPEGSGIIGMWVDDNMPIWTLQFNEDGTGIWNGKFNCTWNTYVTDSSESRISYTLYDSTYFDYTIQGNTLKVYLSDGSKTYSKVGS